MSLVQIEPKLLSRSLSHVIYPSLLSLLRSLTSSTPLSLPVSLCFVSSISPSRIIIISINMYEYVYHFYFFIITLTIAIHPH